MSSASATDLPTEYFASLPDLSRVRLSPDGENIIWLVRVETEKRQGQLIQIVNTKTGKQKNIAFTDNEKYKIRGLRWANEETVILYADFPASRYGTPTTESRIVKLDTNTGEIKAVIPRSLLRKQKYQSNHMSNVIDFLPDDKDHILVSLAGYASGPEESVLKINLNGSGKSSFEQRTKRNVIDWMTDAKGKVRIGIARDDTTYKIRAKLAWESSWRTLWEFEAFSREAVWPLAFGAKDNEL
ncbi:hypothetical protein [Thalassotalea euphylliae]|uniref:hypothetical protein n=1 Tax=Thalassotalea euphylliae TaxID=1655234 RepID=UPI0021611E34|nr:hypothetical protein [Thalassotalea euphylliae]